MKVLIVSKTKMSKHVCVGAIASNGRYLRLLTEDGLNQPNDTPFQVRQGWEIEFVERPIKTAPHVEDVLLTSKKLTGVLKSQISMLDMVIKYNVPIWRGSPNTLFDGLLNWTDNGSGFINKENGLPSKSVGFWIPDKNLTKKDFWGVKYNYPMSQGWRNMPFVGLEAPIDTIPAGSLVRVSLARWWDTDGTTEPRCSLQLSGWYDIAPVATTTVQVAPTPTYHSDEPDDLPF
jgi:hypothetical protein